MAQSEGSSVIEDSSRANNNPASFFSPRELLCYFNQSGFLSGGGAAGLNLTSLAEMLPEMSGALHRSLKKRSMKVGHVDAGGGSEPLYCQTEWDDLVCWPETAEGQMVTVPCFEEFNGIFYDTSRNATRFCMEGGNWTKSDYSECRVLNGSAGPNEVGNLAITTGVYFFGYCVSLCALAIATIIFLAFKELRCLRNIIHTHLMITYILADMLWIITSSTTTGTGGGFGGGGSSNMLGGVGGVGFDNQTGDRDPEGPQVVESGGGTTGQTNQVPCVTFILLHYFHLTNFFWMGVEGLYLYVLVVKTFVSNIKLRVYACIGWGVPLIVVIAWAVAKWLTQSESPDLQITDPEFAASSCVWLPVNEYDWIFKFPVIFVLFFNLIFLLQIMWVLITKLRSAMNPETQQSIKAFKALVVLMPLLGITYVLVLSGSKEPTYEYLRALLISTQGFLVALLYCFLNGEVRSAIRHRWNRLRLMGPCDFQRRRQPIRDWSPRSRTESIRYTSGPEHDIRKRESVASASTSVTTINSGTGSAGSGGCGYGHSLLNRESASPVPPGGFVDGPQAPQYQFHHQVPSTITDGGGRRGVDVALPSPSSTCTTTLLGKMNKSKSDYQFAPKKEMNGTSSATSSTFTARTEREPRKMDYLQVPTCTKY